MSPREAAGKQQLRIRLMASVLIVEQAAINPRERELFQELRESLGLPRAEMIDPAAVDWERIPLVRLARIDMRRVEDDRLIQLFNRAAMSGATVAALAAAQEIVSRDSMIDGVDAAYRQLIRAEPDADRALEWADQAKQRAQRAGRPAGEWALLRLEVQIERGDPMGVQAALDDLRKNHLKEPGVADATYQLLYTAGLLVPRGADGGPLPAERSPLEVPAAADSHRIWTPGQDAPQPASGGKSAIWTPS
jgi:hypothetical protein